MLNFDIARLAILDLQSSILAFSTPLIPYNLACYTAQLARLKDSRQWLEKAFAIRKTRKLKLMALEDPDLQPLWTNLSQT